jgi:hypothetical protein
MTNYVKSTNFATKDNLASGDPLKIVKGTEINTEFDNIAVAVATKAELASPTFTGTVTIPTVAISAGTITGITDLAVADGGTGASTAANARTNLSAASSGANSDITSITGLTTALTVAQGGTGLATLTANNVVLGNGTSNVQFVAPSTSGNVLVSNGTTWTSGTGTSVNGQTGVIVLTNAGDIGSIGILQNSGNSDVAYGATIAGSTLRHSETTNNGAGLSGSGTPFSHSYFTVNNASYGGGGTALSGTWRKLSSGSIFGTQVLCCGDTNRYWMRGLYIRVS